MDKTALNKYKTQAVRTLRIIEEIEAGNTSQTDIAVKTGSSTSLVEYYLKALKAKKIKRTTRKETSKV